MPLYLSPRPVAEMRARITRPDVLTLVMFAILAIVTGSLMWAIGNEMQELTVSIATECERIGPNDLPQCVALDN